jgi:hypothetical protein
VRTRFEFVVLTLETVEVKDFLGVWSHYSLLGWWWHFADANFDQIDWRLGINECVFTLDNSKPKARVVISASAAGSMRPASASPWFNVISIPIGSLL